MSTYYGFHCEKCKQQGGHLTRQMWGAGNFDIVDTFKFVMLHALQCGASSVVMHSEHDDEGQWVSVDMPGPERVAFLAAAKDIWPHSDDWGIGGREDFAEARAEWEATELARAEASR